MNAEVEENKIEFTFKNAEEQKRFVQVLKQSALKQAEKLIIQKYCEVKNEHK